QRPRMLQVLTCGNSPIFSTAACRQGQFQVVTARISCGNERKEPRGLQGRQPTLPRLGHLGKSPKLLPCQHGTVCRKRVECMGGGGAAVTPCTASLLLLRVLKLG